MLDSAFRTGREPKASSTRRQRMPTTTPESSHAWLARVASAQRERSTPEQLEQLRARGEALRRTKVMAKKASRVRTSMTLSSAAWTAGVQDVSTMPVVSSSSLAARSVSAMAAFSSPAFMSPVSAARGMLSLEEEEAEEEALERTLALTAQQQVADGAIAAETVALQVGGDREAAAIAHDASLSAALAQLEQEPSDEKACMAKFGLYEGFAKMTEDARTATLELWAQSEGEFVLAPAAKAAIAQEIKRVDRAENLGIIDDPRRWFVHGMCKAASRNQKVLDGVLNSITTKLELLSSQTECPVCFEEFGPERPAATLGCAHQTCEKCWSHWSAMCGGRHAVCPLCRRADFVNRVLSAV